MIAQEQTVQEITRRLVEYYRPVKIYLFGLIARGDTGPGSDLDTTWMNSTFASTGGNRKAGVSFSTASRNRRWRRSRYLRPYRSPQI
jgi:predicted nucleotidyltransferase